MLVVGLLSACQATTPLPPSDHDGRRFACSEQPDHLGVCLNVLRPGFVLRVVPGTGTPAESTERLTLVRPGGAVVNVSSPNDLVDAVSIRKAGEALEYLRLFSSYDTVRWFSPRAVEVYPEVQLKESACLVCLSESEWRNLGLRGASVRTRGDGFVVTRTLMRMVDGPWNVRLVESTDLVRPNGSVFSISERSIAEGPEKFPGLVFPHHE